MYGLEKAANKAGTKLEKLFPSIRGVQVNQMLDHFYCAIDIKSKNGASSSYMQIKIDDQFRNQCASMRNQIFKMIVGKQDKQRLMNLRRFEQLVSLVWSALEECTDLLQISNLQCIEDHEQLIKAIVEFKRIMLKDQEMIQSTKDPNPLILIKNAQDRNYLPEEILRYENIATDQRIFVVLQNKIVKGVDLL